MVVIVAAVVDIICVARASPGRRYRRATSVMGEMAVVMVVCQVSDQQSLVAELLGIEDVIDELQRLLRGSGRRERAQTGVSSSPGNGYHADRSAAHIRGKKKRLLFLMEDTLARPRA